jgi:hypothetical protein
MDYGNPQFIAAVKKILRDSGAQLTSSFNDLKNAVHAHWQADEERYQTKPVSVSDLRADVLISVKTYAQRAVKERIWGFTKGVLEVVVAIAVVGYTIVSYRNWLEQIDATNFAGRQTELSRKTLNETTKNFRIDQRPYVITDPHGGTSLPNGQTVIIANDGKRTIFAAGVDAKNIGKSPAVDVRVTKTEYKIGPSKKVARELRDWIPKYGAIGSSVTLVTNTPRVPVSDIHTLTKEEIDALQNGTWDAYIIGAVEYRDMFTPKISPYETTYCYHVQFQGLVFKDCASGEGTFWKLHEIIRQHSKALPQQS